MRTTCFSRALVGALAGLTLSALLQAQGTNGTIQGTVTDPSGALVSGAKVDVKNLRTGVTRSVTTNEQGRYRVPDLIVGDYDAQVTMSGFQTSVQRNISVTVGSERAVDFTLQVGQAQQTITVESQVTQVDTTSAGIATLVESKQITDLPLNGRNYTQLINLAPGVLQTVSGFPSGFYGRGNDFSVAGARPEGQAYLLDNTNVQDFWNHGPGSAVLGTTMGVEAIAEFSTQTNTYSAQFGGAGVAINAVTKSGTNEFHGSAYDYLRNSALDARAFYDPAQIPAFRQNQFGASLGGPIKKDKAFFFANYEGLRRGQGQTRPTFVPDAAAHNGDLPGQPHITPSPLIQQLLSYFPIPATSIGGGLGQYNPVATQIGNEDYFLGRVDYNLSDKDSVFARYVRDSAQFDDPFSGSPIPLWPETHHTGNHYATVEERHIFSPSMINLLRAGFVRTREGSDLNNNLPGLSFYPNRKNGTLTIAGGIAPLGSSIFLPFLFVQNKFSGGDDVYWTHGNHNIKFGAVVERVQSNVDAPGWLGGQYNFNSLADFLNAKPFLFFGPLPSQSDGYRDFRELDLTPYIQDDWKISRNFTLNLGLRYEFVTNPVTSKHPLNAITDYLHSTAFERVPNVFKSNPSVRNFDPRFGFAWDPFNDHKTAIRGGYAIFHNPIAPRTYASAYYFNPPYSFNVTVFPTFPTPTFPATLQPSQSNAVNYDTPTTPYQEQWNFNIQRQLDSATIFTVGYVGSRGVHLFIQRDQNPPTTTIGPDGRRVFSSPGPFGAATNPRVNPALGPYNGAEAMGNSVYHSLQTSLNHRFSHSFQGQLSYTWSHCIDDGSNTYGLEGGFPAQDPYNVASDRGNCLFDRRHVVVASALYSLPIHAQFTGHQLIEGWQVNGFWSAHTGIPFTPSDGFDYPAMGAAFVNPRPNLVAGRTAENIKVGTLRRWFDPTAYVLPPPGELGNAGRNSLFGPSFWDVDFSTFKDFAIKENLKAQFRAEFFNVLNHANWGNPNSSIFTGTGARNPLAGTIISLANPMRQIQFAVKILF
jgi:Carboxypeptidase regulatory-like domain/TonB dependent receptor